MELSEVYRGREATAVKHAILRRYLEKLAYKVGSWCQTLNYVEGFAGPWNAQTDDLSDTSPHIAIDRLCRARDGLAKAKIYGRKIRCVFCEKDRVTADALRSSLSKYTSIDAQVIPGEFLANIDEIRLFTRDPRSPDPRFTFIFVDPTGSTGYDPDKMAPLMKDPNTEILVNFMTKDIIRFVDNPENKARDSFRHLFGRLDGAPPWEGLKGRQREEAIVQAFCSNLRATGSFRYVVAAVVLHPTMARTYFHLVYGTRSDEGLRTFRDAERASLSEHVRLRQIARQRKRIERTHQAEIFSAGELESAGDLENLRDEKHRRALDELTAVLRDSGSALYEEVEIRALQHTLVSSHDVKGWLKDLRADGRIEYEGLAAQERVPKPGKGHRVIWLGR